MSLALGPFQLIRPVAKGGMAEVWRARHREQGIPVAVKVMTERHALDGDYVRRFQDEVRAVAALDHPGVVMVLDHGLIDPDLAAQSSDRLIAGAPWLAMEYASGGTLAQVGVLPWARLRTILLALLEALAHAHARGVIHRDLKPANVLLATRVDARPGLKLSDFGIAWARMARTAPDAPEPQPEERVIVGTPTYMAPEQIRGRWRDYGAWTDLYALGCLAWSLSTGRSPFSRGRVSDTLVAQLRDDPPALASRAPVAPGFEAWLRCLLQKDPAARFQCCADAARALEALGEHAQAGPSTLVPTLDALDDTIEASRASLVEQWAQPDSPSVPPVGGPVVQAHVPRTWRRRAPAPPPVRLVGAGLSLFGLRALPLVGRDDERDRLWSALRDVAVTGRSRLVLVRGAAGTGKSALATWLCRRAHEVGAANHLVARFAPGLPPGEAIRRLGESYLRLGGLDRAQVMERVRAFAGAGTDDHVLALFSEILTHAEVEDHPEVPRVRLTRPSEYYTATRRAWQILARERPVIAWLDDVQWGLHGIGLAGHFLMSPEQAPILLVLTLRDEALDADSREAGWLAQLLQHPAADQLALGPLAPAHRTELLRSLLGLEGSLAARVAERGGGNPLFTVQIVGNWVRRGDIVPTARGFALRDAAGAGLPDDLHAVWAERITAAVQAYPAAARQHLEVAAVLGDEVRWAEWKRACDDPEGFFGDRFPGDDPLRAQLVEQLLAERLAVGTRDAWSFVHGMLRESLERLAREAGRLAQHHRACATMLRDRADDPSVAERIGRHLLEAGEPGDAAPHLIRAAAARLAVAGPDAALVLLEQGLAALDAAGLPQTDRLRVRAAILGGRIALRHGKATRAAAAADAAISAARAHAWHQELAQALKVRAEARIAARQPAEALADLRAIGPAAQRAGRPDLQAGAHLGEAELALSGDRTADAIVALTRGLAVLETAADSPDTAASTAEALLLRGRCHAREGRLEQARADLDAARVRYAALGFAGREAEALDHLGRVAARRGELGVALRHLDRAAQRYEALGSRRALGVRMRLALVHVDRGRTRAALPALEAARASIAQLSRRARSEASAALRIAHAALTGDTATFDENCDALGALRPTEAAAVLVGWLLTLAAAAAAITLDPTRSARARELGARPDHR